MDQDRVAVDRPAGFAFIEGGVKGAVAGLGIFLVPAILEIVRRGLSIELATWTLGAMLAGACFCGADAASGRLRPRALRAFVRLLGGLLAPAAGLAPQYGILQLGSFLAPRLPDLGAFALASGVLGLALVVAGEPDTRPHEAQSFGRLWRSCLAVVVTLSLWGALTTGDFLIGPCFCGGLSSFPFAACVCVAEMVGSVAAGPVAAWLEPGGLEGPENVRGLASRELAMAAFSLRSARRATSPERALAHRHDAREAISRAEALLERAPGAISPREVARRRAEVFLALGRVEEAAALVGSTSADRELEAEVARRRGDPERACETASVWLREVEGDDSLRAHEIRANAWALMALARKDQGRLEEARTSLALARTVSAFYARSFEHWTVEGVASELA